jgi:hypothetical protein
MEQFLPVSGPSASLAALAQVLINDFVLDSAFVAILFLTTGAAEGYTRKQVLSQFRNDYFKTVRTGWATSIMLIPLEVACFRLLPLHFRVLGMNIIDIFWEATISYNVHKNRKSMTTMEEEASSSESATTAPLHGTVVQGCEVAA